MRWDGMGWDEFQVLLCSSGLCCVVLCWARMDGEAVEHWILPNVSGALGLPGGARLLRLPSSLVRSRSRSRSSRLPSPTMIPAWGQLAASLTGSVHEARV